jgi:hypothetical protein
MKDLYFGKFLWALDVIDGTEGPRVSASKMWKAVGGKAGTFQFPGLILRSDPFINRA